MQPEPASQQQSCHEPQHRLDQPQSCSHPHLASGHHHYLPQSVRRSETDSQQGRFGLSPQQTSCVYTRWQSQHAASEQSPAAQPTRSDSLAARANCNGWMQMGSRNAECSSAAAELGWDTVALQSDGQSDDRLSSSSQQQHVKRARLQPCRTLQLAGVAAQQQNLVSVPGSASGDLSAEHMAAPTGHLGAALLVGAHQAADPTPCSAPHLPGGLCSLQQPGPAMVSVGSGQPDIGSTDYTLYDAVHTNADQLAEKRHHDGPVCTMRLLDSASIHRGSLTGVQQKTTAAASARHASSFNLRPQARSSAVPQKQPASLASCMPKLDKQLSARSNGELTAKEVAKLWGVNLKKYVGRGN